MHSLMSLLGALDTIPGTEEQPEERSKEDVLYAEELKDRIERNLTKCRNMTVDKSLLGNLLVQTNSRPSAGVNPHLRIHCHSKRDACHSYSSFIVRRRF